MFDRTLLITTIAALSWILSIFPNSCTNAQLVNGAFLPLFVDPQPDCSGWTFATSPISTAPIVKVFTVIKPPALGHKPPKSYQTCIPPLIAAGTQEEHTQLVHLLGYVDTQQGQRNPQDVQKDIKTYAGWEEAYRPEGIYFDNVPATAAASGSGYSGEGNLDLYEGYATQVRELFGNTSLVVLNPSTLPDPGYFTFSDLIITVNEDYNTFK
ncbi:hypothetical protein GYMLUDRAFT_72892 [Collybiopsis luxurians FD-317 M1]|uniref:Uncharacterized protein n=1 Tax=Collybiopsis luxurians FD-317 M1 TaxID=944289 RepID=A0A0D0CSH8_9AGAR|nr:hypothetical protein GYMLUDRAFT_72892 [Collybiopsis luxurians FD-317 M1]